ncbi:carbohydrate ABC transporter permease [Williamsia sp. CHRR-6]|uniref:carbohydrate ABC transporter permease n=1 Tax=Williamsia sp. CHRR-6 TaxID=2835871 RepID=UPI001BD95CB7|nr:carbohydrate ABC transporter permease [Williamsia sp. CHRR-6]MBT0566924.1 carbohydrate ABC transporter permease [Williamsia sp. CHRR-6]
MTITDERRAAGRTAGRNPLGTAGGYVAMIAVLLFIGIPVYFMIITSLKTQPDVYTSPATWWPPKLHPRNYSDVNDRIQFWTYLRNSLIITFATGGIKFVLGITTAYALVFLRFPFKKVIFFVIISALMVPNQITVISNYALMVNFRNTFLGIIVPLAGVAFGTFLLRNHFLSLPREIIEAARMDGAGHWKLLLRVILPISIPTMVAFAMITLVNEWNEYLWPFLMSDNSSVAPLPIGLTLLQNNENGNNWGQVMAGTILTALPMLIVFLFLQRQMIKGLTTGAVKG